MTGKQRLALQYKKEIIRLNEQKKIIDKQISFYEQLLNDLELYQPQTKDLFSKINKKGDK